MIAQTEAIKAFYLRPHPHLYEINTWSWLEKLSVKFGRLIKIADVPDAQWDLLARQGFDIIWLMGMWQRSPEARRLALSDPANFSEYNQALPDWKPSDVIGSPYAVAGYIPDPRIGSWNDLDGVREKLHARGMALFLDFVGNHTALDHPWTREHPEFYVQGTQKDFEQNPSSFYRVETLKGSAFLALGRDPYFPPWKDVVQLNHFNPQMRTAQTGDLRTIASHCDGVRCDMAMLQLRDIFGRIWAPLIEGIKPPETEFWTEVHAAIPELILLAEAYWGTERRLLDLGFSFVYDKGIYDAVRDGNRQDVDARLAEDVSYQSHLARFLENHDEGRSALVFGRERLPAIATLMGTLPGMRFYYQGEIEGSRTRVPIALRMCADEPPDPVLTQLFDKILRLTNEEAFHNGQWDLLPVTSEGDSTPSSLVAYEWRAKTSWKAIVANLAKNTSSGRVRLKDRPVPAKTLVLVDELNGNRYLRSSEELHNPGLFVRLEGFAAHLFDVAYV